jgi:hypothetical protein
MRPILGVLILLGGLAGCDAAPTDPSPAASLIPGSGPALRAASFTPPPLHEVFLNDPAFALGDIDCGTFTIHETSFLDRVDVITYFNDAGDPVRARLHVEVRERSRSCLPARRSEITPRSVMPLTSQTAY